MAISVVDCIGDACSTLNYSTIAHLRHNPRIQHTQNGQRLPVSRNEHANTSHHTVGHWADEDSWWCAYQFWLANNKQFLQLYCHFRNWKSPCICEKRQQLMCSFGDFYSFVTRSFRIFERNRNETMSIARKISFDWGQIEGRLRADWLRWLKDYHPPVPASSWWEIHLFAWLPMMRTPYTVVTMCVGAGFCRLNLREIIFFDQSTEGAWDI